MVTNQEKSSARRMAGMIRIVVSLICMLWLGHLLWTAPWSRDAALLAGYLSVGLLPLFLIVVLLPEGLRQAFSHKQPEA